jgi:aryl-alcohol dehydrogenase-like predicted oxidoreductase
LGASGLDVSIMALGSWRTFERMPREDGVAVMNAARDAGIDFLDDARYDDETGTAPIPTGYSEVVFGELFRAAGWRREEVTVSNKLWWEHWPDEDAGAELDGSLRRMGLDHVDLIYAIAPPAALPVPDVVGQIAGLLETGRAPCSLAEHAQASDPDMRAVLSRARIGLVAAYVLAGGTLTGKYADGDVVGRARDDDSAVIARGKQVAPRLSALAGEWRIAPAHLAFAYALDHPNLASVLFGATKVRANVQAAEVYSSLTRAQLAAIHALAD